MFLDELEIQQTSPQLQKVMRLQTLTSPCQDKPIILKCYEFNPDQWRKLFKHIHNTPNCYNETLVLDNNKLAEKVEIMAEFSWYFVNQLTISHNLVTSIHLNFLFKMNQSWLNNLLLLNLSNNKIRKDGVKLLIRLGLPKLKTFNIDSNLIGNEGVRVLTKNLWPNLEAIVIADTCSVLNTELSTSLSTIFSSKIMRIRLNYDIFAQISSMNVMNNITAIFHTFIINFNIPKRGLHPCSNWLEQIENDQFREDVEMMSKMFTK